MLIIKPIQEKSLQEALCARCHADYDINCLAYGAWLKPDTDDVETEGEFIGICQFRLGKAATIVTLAKAVGTDDTEAMFIMGRQTMNFIDLHGVHGCYFEADGDEKFVKWLGFAKDEEGRWFCDLEKFFTHPCTADKVAK